MAGRAKKLKTDSPVKNGPRVAANGYRLPDPLPPGEILIDNTKTEWILGESIGCGGFGEIYAARKKDSSDCDYVIKVDHCSGPLYAEMHFYLRVAKEEEINKWMQAKGLKFLGLPRYIGFGIHEHSTKPTAGRTRGRQKKATTSTESPTKYRFLVMQRFGEDLQKILQANNNRFPLITAYKLAINIIDILEYIHSHGYIHADIKASNLLLVRQKESARKTTKVNKYQSNEVYLVDYGLVERYISREAGEHRPYSEDIRRANNGTTEFASRDAHIGAFSRRSDLEILAYNILSWTSGGRLPWMSNLKDHNYVRHCKEYYMSKLHELVNYCYSKDTSASSSSSSSPKVFANGNALNHQNTSNTKKQNVIDRKKLIANVPIGIVEVLQYIVNLEFTEQPDYHLLKEIFKSSIEKLGGKANDDKISFDNSFEENLPKLKTRQLTLTVSPQKKHSLIDDKDEKKLNANNNRNANKRVKKGQNVNKNDNEVKPVASANNNNHHQSPHQNTTPTPQMLELMRKQRARASKATAKKSSSAPASSLSPRSKSVSPDRNSSSPFNRPTPQMLELMKKLKQKKMKLKRLS